MANYEQFVISKSIMSNTKVVFLNVDNLVVVYTRGKNFRSLIIARSIKFDQQAVCVGTIYELAKEKVG